LGGGHGGRQGPGQRTVHRCNTYRGQDGGIPRFTVRHHDFREVLPEEDVQPKLLLARRRPTLNHSSKRVRFPRSCWVDHLPFGVPNHLRRVPRHGALISNIATDPTAGGGEPNRPPRFHILSHYHCATTGFRPGVASVSVSAYPSSPRLRAIGSPPLHACLSVPSR